MTAQRDGEDWAEPSDGASESRADARCEVHTAYADACVCHRFDVHQAVLCAHDACLASC
jgi:hypothetical protein